MIMKWSKGQRVMIMKWSKGLAAALGILLLAACGGDDPLPPPDGRELSLLILGDSLSAGLGLSPEKGFAPQLEALLLARGWRVRIHNASVSGATTGDGILMLDTALEEGSFDAVLVELGANDMLRGHPPENVERNLDQILGRLDETGAVILLAGMKAQGPLRRRYQSGTFAAIYARLAADRALALYPFFLEGVALKPRYNLPDRIHPNAAGIAEITRRILPSVEAVLQAAARAP